jgi:hypothetical protein
MRVTSFAIITAGTLLMVWVMQKTGAPLKTTVTPFGILNLELASSESQVSAILNTWDADKVDAAKLNTALDFIFLVFYSLFLFTACNTIAQRFTGFVRQTGIALAYGALAAGMLDVVENIGMLVSLYGNTSDWVSIITCLAAVIKWVLALAALAFVLIMAIPYWMSKNNGPQHHRHP